MIYEFASSNPAIFAAIIAIVCLAAVEAVRLRARCLHRWRAVGTVQQRNFFGEGKSPARGDLPESIEYHQNVRCVKCGLNTYHVVGGPGSDPDNDEEDEG